MFAINFIVFTQFVNFFSKNGSFLTKTIKTLTILKNTLVEYHTNNILY